MQPNQIEKFKIKKKDYILYINDNYYVIDEFLYQCILPYEGKILEVCDMLDVIAFSSAHNVLLKLYRKVFSHTISKYDFECKLKDADLNEDQINLIVDKLINESYLNDDDFISHYKEIYQYSKGRNAFKSFLIKNHIGSFKIEKTLQTYNEDFDLAIDYANRYVNTKIGSNAMLKQKVKMNLINKGYSNECVDFVISNLKFNNEDKNLIKEVNILQKKYPDDYYKIVSKLRTKGYNLNDIKKVMKEKELNEN